MPSWNWGQYNWGDQNWSAAEHFLSLFENIGISEAWIDYGIFHSLQPANSDFIAAQHSQYNSPLSGAWLYLGSDIVDLSSRIISISSIDYEIPDIFETTSQIIASDVVIELDNTDNYLTDYADASVLYNKTYVGSKVIVWAGFRLHTIPSNHDSLIAVATQKLVKIENMLHERKVRLYCTDYMKNALETYVGLPDADGVATPLTYTAKTFKYIIEDLLVTYADLTLSDLDIEDVSLFSTLTISFEEKTVAECLQILAEIAFGSFNTTGAGKIQYRSFPNEPTIVDYSLPSNRIQKLWYTGQDWDRNRISKVVVIGASGIYAASGSGTGNQVMKINNTYVTANGLAADMAENYLNRILMSQKVIEIDGEFLPSIQVRNIINVEEVSSIMLLVNYSLNPTDWTTRMKLIFYFYGKTWDTESELNTGTFSNTRVPSGYDHVELAASTSITTGTATFDFGDTTTTKNWQSFRDNISLLERKK